MSNKTLAEIHSELSQLKRRKKELFSFIDSTLLALEEDGAMPQRQWITYKRAFNINGWFIGQSKRAIEIYKYQLNKAQETLNSGRASSGKRKYCENQITRLECAIENEENTVKKILQEVRALKAEARKKAVELKPYLKEIFEEHDTNNEKINTLHKELDIIRDKK